MEVIKATLMWVAVSISIVGLGGLPYEPLSWGLVAEVLTGPLYLILFVRREIRAGMLMITLGVAGFLGLTVIGEELTTPGAVVSATQAARDRSATLLYVGYLAAAGLLYVRLRRAHAARSADDRGTRR